MQNMWSLNLLHGPLGCYQIQLFAVNIDEKLHMCIYSRMNEVDASLILKLHT